MIPIIIAITITLSVILGRQLYYLDTYYREGGSRWCRKCEQEYRLYNGHWHYQWPITRPGDIDNPDACICQEG